MPLLVCPQRLGVKRKDPSRDRPFDLSCGRVGEGQTGGPGRQKVLSSESIRLVLSREVQGRQPYVELHVRIRISFEEDVMFIVKSRSDRKQHFFVDVTDHPG